MLFLHHRCVKAFPKVNTGLVKVKNLGVELDFLSLCAADMHELCPRVSSLSGWFTDSTDDLLLLQKPFNVITADSFNV